MVDVVEVQVPAPVTVVTVQVPLPVTLIEVDVPGLPGPQGNPGTNGAPGSKFYSGTGAPGAGLGIVGDWYINDANGDLYEKTGASTWTLRDNLTGPPGATGQAEGWSSGSGAPAGGVGAVGDWYLDTTAGDVYEKTGASTWTLRGNIKGPAGSPGTNGTNGELWFNGTGAPSGATGSIGDMYIDNSTGDYYEKTGASTWTLRGNLKGPAGAGSGDVVGPASSTDNAIARFDGTTGKLIQNSGVTIDDNGKLTGVASAAGYSSVNLPPGTAPSSPSDGDLWFTTTGFFMRYGGNPAMQVERVGHVHPANDITSGTLAAGRMPALTGDVTTTVGTVATTIANDAVTNAKLANMAANSIKLNNTGAAADPIDGTVAQLNAMINSTVAPTFANVSGKPTTISGYGITDGVVGPASATDNAIARFDLTTGKLIQNSGAIIDDNGKIIVPASTSASAGLNNPPGAAPTSPVNGDIWSTSTAFFCRINGVTQTVMTLAGGTMTGKITTLASATGGAGLNVPAGTAPSAPVNGDFWSITADFQARVNGVTETVAWISDLALYATLASPTFTGTPAAPTATLTDSSTQIATTAFVQGAAQLINTQTASYTLALTDAGKLVEMNVASANNLTVPANATVAFPIGTRIDGAQYGAGQTTIVPGGVTVLRSAGGKLKANAQYSGWTMEKRGTNEWYVWGDLTT